MPGARCTRRLVCKGRSSKHTSSTGPPKSPGIPAREWFYGLFRALPGDRAFLSPSPAAEGLVRPVGLATPPQT